MGGKLIKNLGREIGWFILARTLATLKKETDLTLLYRRAEFMGRMGMSLARSRWKLLLANLRIAFPEWSDRAIEITARKAVGNISRGFVDVFYHSYHLDLLPDHVRLEENGVLENLLMQNRGFIAATGHVGAFPYLGVPVVRRGFPFAPIARDPHDERLKAVFDDSCNAAGYTIIPDRPPMTVLRRTTKVLRKCGVVMVTFDMHPAGRGGLPVKFLGRETPMFSTVVRLAAKAQVPLVPGHVLWEPDRRNFRVTFYPPIEVPPEAADEESSVTRELLQGLADWLSDVIRSNPEQWWGIHRRWR